jgi:threonine/homoserine/homoserine lactone efflux protein
MSHPELVAFFVFGFTAAVTPGPSNMLVMTAGAQGGLVRGLWCLFGVVAGMALMMGAAVAGLGGVIATRPILLDALKWLGTAFLLWLSWKVANAPAVRQDDQSEVIGFWKSLAFQWVNPKSWVVSASAAASYGSALPGTVAER